MKHDEACKVLQEAVGVIFKVLSQYSAKRT